MVREAMALAMFDRVGMPQLALRLRADVDQRRVPGALRARRADRRTSSSAACTRIRAATCTNTSGCTNSGSAYPGGDLAVYAPLFEPRSHRLESAETLYGPLARSLPRREPDGRRRLAGEVETRLDLGQLVRYIAIEAYTGENDGILGNWGINNHYWYRPSNSARHQIIPWDRDLAFTFLTGRSSPASRRTRSCAAPWRSRICASCSSSPSRSAVNTARRKRLVPERARAHRRADHAGGRRGRAKAASTAKFLEGLDFMRAVRGRAARYRARRDRAEPIGERQMADVSPVSRWTMPRPWSSRRRHAVDARRPGGDRRRRQRRAPAPGDGAHRRRRALDGRERRRPGAADRRREVERHDRSRAGAIAGTGAVRIGVRHVRRQRHRRRARFRLPCPATSPASPAARSASSSGWSPASPIRPPGSSSTCNRAASTCSSATTRRTATSRSGPTATASARG